MEYAELTGKRWDFRLLVGLVVAVGTVAAVGASIVLRPDGSEGEASLYEPCPLVDETFVASMSEQERAAAEAYRAADPAGKFAIRSERLNEVGKAPHELRRGVSLSDGAVEEGAVPELAAKAASVVKARFRGLEPSERGMVALFTVQEVLKGDADESSELRVAAPSSVVYDPLQPLVPCGLILVEAPWFTTPEVGGEAFLLLRDAHEFEARTAPLEPLPGRGLFRVVDGMIAEAWTSVREMDAQVFEDLLREGIATGS